MDTVTVASAAAQQEAYIAISGMITTSRICMAVSLAIVVWDWLSTLHLEVVHVWKSKKLLSVMNVAFFLNRYSCIITLSIMLALMYLPQSQHDLCERVHLLGPYLSIATYMAASCIVTVRVFAVWQKNRAPPGDGSWLILLHFSVLLLAQLGLQLWTPSRAEVAELPPRIDACILKDVNPYSWLYYASMMVFDSAVLVLMLIATWKFYAQSGFSKLSLLLLRDQLLFYTLTFAAALANLIHYVRRGEHHNPGLLSPFTLAVVSIAANRILLNLRSLSTSEPPVSGASDSSNRRKHLFGPYPSAVPVTPLSPVHHPRYPQRSLDRDAEKEGVYELEKYRTGKLEPGDLQ